MIRRLCTWERLILSVEIKSSSFPGIPVTMSTYVNKMEMEQISYKILSSVVMVACSRHSDRRSRRLRRRERKRHAKSWLSQFSGSDYLGAFEQAMVIDTLKQNDAPLRLPSVTSKRGHETKKHVLIGCQTWRIKQTVAPNLSCLYVFYQRVPLTFHFSQLSGICISRSETAHLTSEIILYV